ncbi:MAG: hypothetical protein U0228_10460 [Myxococcaceae bacterium]
MRASRGLGTAAWLVAVCATPALAQKTVELHLGDWRASYSEYASKEAVCDAEPQWLAEELHSMNVLLDAFLDKGTTRRGAWAEGDLPLLEQAVKVLPAAVKAHEFALGALPSCAVAKSGRLPDILARGQKLLAEAKDEVGRLPELAAFTKKRVKLERWERDRAEAEAAAQATCKGSKPTELRIYFAWQDEFGVRRWKFCDGAVVEARPTKPWDYLVPEGAKSDPKRATLGIQTARLHPEAQVLRAP